MKICASCKHEYSIDNFPKDKSNKSGYRSYCFPCNRKKVNEASFKRREKRHEKNKNDQEYISNYNKLYYNKNKHVFQKNYKKYLDTNPQFKLIHNTRIRINTALKNNSKFSSSYSLLGCDLDKYKKYLEQQFKHDMTWDNYGILWEIDHIKPCASFDLSEPKQQLECFNYKNTQPLYKVENQRKGSRV